MAAGAGRDARDDHDYVVALVDEMPPLTEDQRARLSVLFRGSPSPDQQAQARRRNRRTRRRALPGPGSPTPRGEGPAASEG